MNAAPVAPLRLVTQPRTALKISARAIKLRSGELADAAQIHALVLDHLEEGHLLPRTLEEISLHTARFVVAEHRGVVIGCAELAPLSSTVAEIRSLVVSRHARGLGLSRRLINELVHRATVAGFHKLCAFAHSPAYFVRLGFSIVPHQWLPEKIVTDCRTCVHFRHCGQYAVMHALTRTREACVPLAALHG